MNILVFAASNSRQSINKALVSHAADVFKAEMAADAEIHLIDLNDYEMAIFSIDRENASGIPEQAHALNKLIAEADALMISYAEHNGNYSAAYKNIFDWMSRLGRKIFHDKPMVVMATSPGKMGGSNVLNLAINSAPHFAAEIVGSFSVPHFDDAFDLDAGALTNEEAKAAMRAALRALRDRLC